MDTISSRETNTNYLPWAGVIAGAIALLFAVVAFMKVNSLKNEIADLKSVSARVDGIEMQNSQTARLANDTRESLIKTVNDVSTYFKQHSDKIARLEDSLGKLETVRLPPPRPQPPPQQTAAPASAATGAPARAATTAATTPAPATGTGEYTVKSGDTGVKIASAHGVKLGELINANPDVDWNRLRPGQKIKIPRK